MPILSVKNLDKSYISGFNGFKRKYVKALDAITFDLYAGETLAVVGESGSGKTTLARILSGAEQCSGGEIWFEEKPLESYSMQKKCSMIRMIFQNAQSSLNPNIRIGQLLDEPLRFNTQLSSEARQQIIYETLTTVGLLPEHAAFYPHMVSSGQRQRISIARAIMLKPKIIVADGALATLDVLVRAQIVTLLKRLQKDLKISFVLVSHDLHVVRHVSDRIIVLANGKIVETAKTADLFEHPQEEYTRRLLKEQSVMLERSK
jgi:cationic peptide transport system ATP-binding protein